MSYGQLFNFHLITGHEFPETFSAYWIRFVSDEDTTDTATLIYQ